MKQQPKSKTELVRKKRTGANAPSHPSKCSSFLSQESLFLSNIFPRRGRHFASDSVLRSFPRLLLILILFIMRRTTMKRAAAALAEEKIKRSIEDINRDWEDCNDKRSTFDFLAGDEATLMTKRTLTFSHNIVNKEIHQKRARKKSKTDAAAQPAADYSDDVPTFHQSEDHPPFYGYRPSRAMPSTAILERSEHQKKKAARQVHSNGPMILSRRTCYKIAMDASPIYSPIAAIRFSFTPEYCVRARLMSSSGKRGGWSPPSHMRG
jgi:hypothetical protein